MPCVDQGWRAIPISLLRYAGPLGISPSEGWLLVQLLDLKWSNDTSTLHELQDRCRMDPVEIHSVLLSLQERSYLRLRMKVSRVSAPADVSNESPARANPCSGWEIDLSPLVRLMNDYIMRDGDLGAGFLRFSPVSVEKPDAP